MIRTFTIEDIPRIVEMAVGSHELLLQDKGILYKPSDFAKFCVLALESPDTTILVMEKEGELVGTFGCVISPNYLNFSQTILQEIWWWVDPKHRGGVEAIKMVKRGIEWGKEMGATIIILTSTLFPKSDSVDKVYQRLGFTPYEHRWIKEI